MYPCYEKNLVPGAESCSWPRIISENLLYLCIWTLAGVLLSPIWTPGGFPVLALFWTLLVIVVQILLKKHNCSGCHYYGKLCHLGWGRLSSAWFKQDSGNPETGKKLSLFYIVSPPAILLISLIFALISKTGSDYWLLILTFVVLNALTFPVRIKGCRRCTMRETCPGSAVKTRQPIIKR